jgi:mono/diheme cytochrome c family protein
LIQFPRKKILLFCLGISFVFAGCVAIQHQVTSWSKGQDYFYYQSLGQPLKTGIPYVLWLAMMEQYPKEMGNNWDESSQKFGLVKDPNKNDGLPVGFAITNEPWTNTQFLMTNCSLCHTSKIDGKIVQGLGSRDLRLNTLNNTVMSLAKREDFSEEKILPAAKAAAQKFNLDWGFRTKIAVQMAIKEIKKREATHIYMESGPGRNTPIEFAKLATHVDIEKPYGFVRFPPVWTYVKRQTFGWDGSMHGDLALAAASVEFNKGMSSDYIVAHKDRWDDIYTYVSSLKAPVYPKPINQKLAESGKKLYVNNCQSCHGGDKYSEKIIPIQEIGTDSDRLKAMNQALADARNVTGFGKIVPLETSDGYVAPPLDGIWSRAPYLHNGSVPTLYDLLQPVAKRPTTFYLGSEVLYDFQQIGIQSVLKNTSGLYQFDTTKEGNLNKGHEYGVRLSNKDKKALLEYLKTL